MIISIKSDEDADALHMIYWVLIESGIGMLVGILFSYGVYKFKEFLGIPHNFIKSDEGDIELGKTEKRTAEIGVMTEEPEEHKDPLMRPVSVNII